MTIKEPKWSSCENSKGIINDYHNAESFNIDRPVKTGMQVMAKYGQSNVSLVITKINPNGNFTATIQGFSPMNISHPADLKEDDEVLIDREHICWT